MENKIALRCVQNGDILLQDCFVPDADRLPGAWVGPAALTQRASMLMLSSLADQGCAHSCGWPPC
jgi:alkylation response protein AidB-like acyl-CoA dehydrogenase